MAERGNPVKKRIIFIVLAFAALAISGFLIVRLISERSEPQIPNPEPIFNINADDVSRIVIADGNTGRRVQVEDRDEIANIVDDVNSMQYVGKKALSEIRLGWFLWLDLYDNSGNTITSFRPQGPGILEVDGEWWYTLEIPSPFYNDFHARYFD